MKISRKDPIVRAIHFTILLLILAAPFIQVNEINIGLGGVYILPDFGVRAIKEYGQIALIILGGIAFLTRKRYNPLLKLLPFMLFALFIVVFNSINVPNNVLLCGIRWILPLFLPIFLYGFIDDNFLVKCYKALTVVFVIHLFLQVIELFVMPPYNGTTYFGLTARVPGLFNRSHGAAYFTCLYYLLIIGFENNKIIRKAGTIFVIISLLLAASSTGIIVFLVIFLLNRYKGTKYWNSIVFLIPFVVVVTFLNADSITNRRTGSSESSVGTRLDRFEMITSGTTLISDKFGYATNGVFTMSQTTNIRVNQNLFADSYYNSLFGNLGYIFSFIIIFSVLAIMFNLFLNRQVYALMFLIFYFLFAVSNIITEVYPGNLFFGIIIAYFVRNLKKENRYHILKQELYIS